MFKRMSRDDGLVLLDLGSGQSSPRTALRPHLATRRRRQHVQDGRHPSHRHRWNGTPDVVDRDVDEFIDNLKQQRLVVEA